MKKYLVIGNPIEHSLSPKLHNYWFQNNNIKAVYEKQKLAEEDFENLIVKIKKEKIHGVNVTVPFKKTIIRYLDQLSTEAKNTESVNTIYLDNKKIIGHNTDINGFKISIEKQNFDLINKKVLILGAGGVVPSIIFALNKMNVSEITISNRTKQKAQNLKNLFKNLNVVDWGIIPEFDMVINATSIGLKENDYLNLDFSQIGKNKFFFDVIYNPKQTNFLKTAKNLGHKTENGKMMFIYQASEAFKLWHGIEPKINKATMELLD